MNTQEYKDFFENLSKDTPIEEYENIFSIKAKFEDPFHKVEGVQEIYNVFKMMYKKLDSPIFKVKEIVENSNIAYFKWDFYFYFKNKTKKQSFEGVSRIEFDKEGKVVSHVDYWDSAKTYMRKFHFYQHYLVF
ncbi:MAG: nuclear transport factor 2 family protein [Halarcobacter sp.]